MFTYDFSFNKFQELQYRRIRGRRYPYAMLGLYTHILECIQGEHFQPESESYLAYDC